MDVPRLLPSMDRLDFNGYLTAWYKMGEDQCGWPWWSFQGSFATLPGKVRSVGWAIYYGLLLRTTTNASPRLKGSFKCHSQCWKRQVCRRVITAIAPVSEPRGLYLLADDLPIVQHEKEEHRACVNLAILLPFTGPVDWIFTGWKISSIVQSTEKNSSCNLET